MGKAFALVMTEAPLRGGQVYVDTTLSGRGNVRFWVDTGYSGDGDMRLKPHLFQKMVDTHPPSRTGVDTSFGQRTWRMAELPSVEFGGTQYKHLLIGEMPPDLIKVPAWMSLQFLARYQVTFNFPKRVMYLKQLHLAEPYTKP